MTFLVVGYNSSTTAADLTDTSVHLVDVTMRVKSGIPAGTYSKALDIMANDMINTAGIQYVTEKEGTIYNKKLRIPQNNQDSKSENMAQNLKIIMNS